MQSHLAEDRLFDETLDLHSKGLPFLPPSGEASATQLSNDELIEKIRAAVNTVMKQYRVVGTAVSVIHNGQLLMAEGFGKADIAHDFNVTSKTLFQIASNSKAFTAMAVLTLADEGLLDLDQPIRNFYPSFRLKVLLPLLLLICVWLGFLIDLNVHNIRMK
jgi:CubicO group peptidase (beta-lactamase class C family)